MIKEIKKLSLFLRKNKNYNKLRELNSIIKKFSSPEDDVSQFICPEGSTPDIQNLRVNGVVVNFCKGDINNFTVFNTALAILANSLSENSDKKIEINRTIGAIIEGNQAFAKDSFTILISDEAYQVATDTSRGASLFTLKNMLFQNKPYVRDVNFVPINTKQEASIVLEMLAIARDLNMGSVSGNTSYNDELNKAVDFQKMEDLSSSMLLVEKEDLDAFMSARNPNCNQPLFTITVLLDPKQRIEGFNMDQGRNRDTVKLNYCRPVDQGKYPIMANLMEVFINSNLDANKDIKEQMNQELQFLRNPGGPPVGGEPPPVGGEPPPVGGETPPPPDDPLPPIADTSTPDDQDKNIFEQAKDFYEKNKRYLSDLGISFNSILEWLGGDSSPRTPSREIDSPGESNPEPSSGDVTSPRESGEDREVTPPPPTEAELAAQRRRALEERRRRRRGTQTRRPSQIVPLVSTVSREGRSIGLYENKSVPASAPIEQKYLEIANDGSGWKEAELTNPERRELIKSMRGTITKPKNHLDFLRELERSRISGAKGNTSREEKWRERATSHQGRRNWR